MRRYRTIGGIALGVLAVLLLAAPAQAGDAPGGDPEFVAHVNRAWVLLMGIMTLLLTAGHLLLGLAGAPREARGRAAGLVVGGTLVAAWGYFATGFAFQYGGIGSIPVLGGGQSLWAEWFPLHRFWGEGWGLIGYTGFLLWGLAEPPVLTFFFFQLTLLLATVSIPLATLAAWTAPHSAPRGEGQGAARVRNGAVLILALAWAGFVFPLFGNWAWGRGWLSQTGHTLGAGHGYVDFAGSGVVFLAGALAALAVLVTLGTRPAEEARPGDETLLAAGGLLTLVGGLTLTLGNFLGLTDERMALTVANVLGAALSGGAASFVYLGFVARRLDVPLGVRGLLAGLAASAAGGPFVAPASAAVIGLVAGVLACLGTHLLDRVLRLPDRTGLVAAYGLGGLWGLLAVGLFADGTYGTGWNGVGLSAYLGTTGQGVTGYLPAGGLVSDPGQINAQVAGIVAVIAVAFVLSLLLARTLNRLGWLLSRPDVPSADERSTTTDH